VLLCIASASESVSVNVGPIRLQADRSSTGKLNHFTSRYNYILAQINIMILSVSWKNFLQNESRSSTNYSFTYRTAVSCYSMICALFDRAVRHVTCPSSRHKSRRKNCYLYYLYIGLSLIIFNERLYHQAPSIFPRLWIACAMLLCSINIPALISQTVPFFQDHSHNTRFGNQVSALKAISASIIQGSAIGPVSYVITASDLQPVSQRNFIL